MRRIRIILCAMVMVILSSHKVYADFEVGAIIYTTRWISEDGYCDIVRYSRGLFKQLRIPSNVTYEGKTYKVRKIREGAFYNSELTRVIIPESIEEIDYKAFKDSKNLEKIEISGSPLVANDAFDGTKWMENQPDGPVYLGDIYLHCKNVDNISLEIKDGTKYIASCDAIGWGIFNGMTGEYEIPYINRKKDDSPSQIKIPGSVKTWGKSSFTYNTNLSSVTIENGVKYIPDVAFGYCQKLTSVAIPNSVTEIGWGAFSDCSSLTSITIPNSVTEIKKVAFGGCSSLTSITIPNSVTKIGEYAFSGCSSLKSVTISSSVTRIERSTFRHCSGLTSLTIPNKIDTIEKDAFYDCGNIEKIEVRNIIPPYFADANKVLGTTCVLYVPRGTKRMYEKADGWKDFADIIEKDMDMPTVNTIKGGETLEDGGMKYRFNDNKSVTLIEADKTCVYANIPTSIEYAGLKFSVTNIGDSAFYDCYNLSSVKIPQSVTSLGRDAFHGCSGLKSVQIPNSVTSLGRNAFYGCSGLESVLIPNSVTNVGECAFYDCSGLNTVTVSDGVKTIGDSTFYGCSNLRYAHIPEGIKRIPNSSFYGCSSLRNINIPDSVTYIGTSAFEGTGITSITLSFGTDRIPFIGDRAFAKCKDLVSLSISAEEIVVGKQILDKCSYLRAFTLDVKDPWENLKTNRDLGKDIGSWVDSTILYVPKGLTQVYRNIFADYCNSWVRYGGFFIKELDDVTAIISVKKDVAGAVEAVYGPDGQKHNAPQKGVNIIRYSDGTTKKTLVR